MDGLLTLTSLGSLIGLLLTAVTIWVTWAKLRPEKNKLESEASLTAVQAAEIVASKALDLMSNMEATLQFEKSRMTETLQQVRSELAASQNEVKGLLGNVQQSSEVIRDREKTINQLQRRCNVLLYHLKDYAKAIQDLVEQVESLGHKPNYKLSDEIDWREWERDL